MEKLLTLEEIAENLHMEVNSARRFVKREKLGIKVGKRVFVPESDWKEFIKRKKNKEKKVAKYIQFQYGGRPWNMPIKGSRDKPALNNSGNATPIGFDANGARTEFPGEIYDIDAENLYIRDEFGTEHSIPYTFTEQ